jgi:hypothetical protein
LKGVEVTASPRRKQQLQRQRERQGQGLQQQNSGGVHVDDLQSVLAMEDSASALKAAIQDEIDGFQEHLTDLFES